MHAVRGFLHRAAISFCLLALPSVASAEDADAGGVTLETINQEIQSKSTELASLSQRERTLQEELKSNKLEISDLRSQRDAAASEMTKAKDERAKLQRELEQNAARIGQLSETARQRLRALYKVQSPAVVEQLLFTSSVQSLSRNAVYASHLQRADRTMISELSERTDRYKDEQARLEALLVQQGELQRKLSAREIELKSKAARQQAIIAQLTSERAGIQAALTGLRAQALRLESVVASITEGPEPEAVRPKQERQAPQPGGVMPFKGQGLLALKGRLAPPVEAKVRRASKVKSGTDIVGDEIFKRGVEFDALPHTPVKAVAPARVLFTGRMPVYGTVVILDHGQRFYTLYARLGDVDVQKGAVVDSGQVIGSVAADGDRGFYFEVRKNGVPVSPMGFIRTAS